MENLTKTSIVEVFNFDKSSVRTVAIDNDFWFVAADIAEVLGYADTHSAVRYLDDDEKTTHKVDVEWSNQHGPAGVQSQEMVIINESGLYNAIFRSQKEAAKAFRKWVTSEVLPSLRKHGVYRLETELRQMQQNLNQQIRLRDKLFEEVWQLESCPTKSAARDRERLFKTVSGRLEDEVEILKLKLWVYEKALDEVILISNTMHDDANGDTYPRCKAVEKVMGWHYGEMYSLSNKGKLTGKSIKEKS